MSRRRKPIRRASGTAPEDATPLGHLSDAQLFKELARRFYRKAGFTTVATVVSKKSGKFRLLMSKEL